MHTTVGTSLIEILISLFLLSLLLLGWDVMQISVLQIMQNASHSNIAQQQLLSMAETIKSNNGVNANDITLWQQQNQKLLPQGRGKISGQYPSFILSIIWGNKSSSKYQHTIGNAGCLQLIIKL